MISDVIAACTLCGDVQPHPLLIRCFSDRANYIRLERNYFMVFFLTVNSYILSLDINVYHHIFPLNRQYVEMISDLLAAYTLCGNVQPLPLLIRYFRDRANCIRLERKYFQISLLRVNSCILSLDINVYHHIFPLIFCYHIHPSNRQRPQLSHISHQPIVL